MSFVTRLTYRSGDGDRLASTVERIKHRAERKGVQLKGPHAEPPTHHSVPQHKGMPGTGAFEPWQYTVYSRVIEVVDNTGFVRKLSEQEYHDSIHLTVEVD